MIRNPCDTGVAAAKVALPGCVALIEQVPVATKVTVFPATVHVVGVFEEKATGSPEDAVAETVKGGADRTWLGSGPKVIVWASLVTWKL